jgi:outer membrane protein TolC
MKILKITGTCLSAMLVGCQVSESSPFDPRAMQQPERRGATGVRSQPNQPLPTTLESPILTGTQGPSAVQEPTRPPSTGPSLEGAQVLRLPLQEVIHRAVANNLEVKVAGYQPAIDETRVTEAEARYDPVFFNNLSYSRTDNENGFGFGRNNGRNILEEVGIRQNFWSGGNAQLSYRSSWTEPRNFSTDFSGQRTVGDTFWDNQVVLEVTQPLLRDFGNDINYARISINRDNQRISLLEFRKQLETTATDIERTYWQLVGAERGVRIAENLLDNTIATGQVLSARRNQDVTRVQLSQANASIESRRAALIQAKARVRDLSDQLKRFMNDPEIPVSSGTLILPANAPSEEPLVFELEDQINTALENRLELGEQQLRVRSADTALRVANNNLLPRLHAVGSISVQGLENDFGRATNEQLGSTNLNYTIGLQFEIPIGNREARAIKRRAQLQRLQAIDQYANLIQQVSLEVQIALREVKTSWDLMAATRMSRFAAADSLLAIQQRQDAGEALTPTFVQLKLDTQERLANSQTQEVDAISNYNIAIARLEQAKGTLLRYNNIVMEEESLPYGMKK